MRTQTAAATALAAALALGGLTACGGGNSLENQGKGGGSNSGSGGGKGSLVVGSADFTESRVLANMYAQVLQKAGYKATVQTVQNRETYEPALQKGQLAVVPEYAATLAEWLNAKKNGPKAPDTHPVASPDIASTMANLNKLAGGYGLQALKPGKAIDQNAFAVSKSFAAAHHLKTLSDLGKAKVPVKIAAGPECTTRPFCAPGLQKKYGIKVSGIDRKGVGTVVAKQAVQRGTDQLVLTTTTDATLDTYKLQLLQDDKKLQNADYVVPLVNKKLAAKPAVESALNKLNATLTTAELAQLNGKVDAERQKPEDVARAYLKEKGLV